jgi:hypothetical protein
MKDEREERKGTIMDHTVFLAICFPLVIVGMILVIMWGMSIVGPQGQGSSNRRLAAHSVNDLVYRIRRMNRTDMIQGFVPWDSTRDVPQEYAFQPPLAEVAYRHALKELLVEQARLTTQEREAAQQPFNLTS